MSAHFTSLNSNYYRAAVYGVIGGHKCGYGFHCLSFFMCSISALGSRQAIV